MRRKNVKISNTFRDSIESSVDKFQIESYEIFFNPFRIYPQFNTNTTDEKSF